MLRPPCRACWPKKLPPLRGGPAMQAPTSERQGLCKNSTALSKFHRRGEHCSPAKALRYHKAPGWSRAPPLQYAARECVEFLTLFWDFAVGAGLGSARPCRACWPKKLPPHRCGPAMQAPTSKRQGLCKNSIALSKFHRRGEHCSPALAAAANPKIFSRTVAGLQCRPLQAKGKAYAKILLLFINFIVGSSIARPPKPCGITRPPGWSRAPPLP